jgi:hypothetical protein
MLSHFSVVKWAGRLKNEIKESQGCRGSESLSVPHLYLYYHQLAGVSTPLAKKFLKNFFSGWLTRDWDYGILFIERKVCGMEKVIVEIGFGIVCFFFMLALCVSVSCAWGCLVGLGILGLGWMFWDE